MGRFHVLIVEDELIIAEMLKGMLLEMGYTVSGIAADHDQALELLDSDSNINFAICDINLNAELSGIDFGNMFKEKFGLPFIYLTSYYDKQTLSDAAATKPSGYLIKPFTEADIASTLMVIESREAPQTKELSIKDGHKTVKIETNGIQYIASDGNYITLFTETQKVVLRSSLDNILVELNQPQFKRVHRSYVVNLQQVKSFSSQSVMVPLAKIPLSRKYKSEILDLLE